MNKLKDNSEFLKILSSKQKIFTKTLCFYYTFEKVRKKQEKGFLYGISVSKKYGNAPKRNKFKRIVREIVRKEKKLFPENITFFVKPNLKNQISKIKFQEIDEEIKNIIRRIDEIS